MLELLISGPESSQSLRREIPDGEVIRLGRAPRNGWQVPWDLLISREHCELTLWNGRLRVTRLDSARNPVYFQDADTREFLMAPGQSFRIGQTVFQLVSIDFTEGPSGSGSRLEEHSFAPDALRKIRFHDAEKRLEIVTKLPDAIAKTRTDEELAREAVKMLVSAMPYAKAAACIQYPLTLDPNDTPMILALNTRNEDQGSFNPSRRLMTQAISRGEGMMHIWQECEGSNPAFTVSGNLDWAFFMPLKGEACRGWGFYLTGRLGSPGATAISDTDLKGDLRFTELVGDFISSIRSVRTLEKQQAGLTQFFSPAVIEAVRKGNAESVLEPREAEITVLFCDVRGFSRKAEAAHADLKQLLNRVSSALGVMTAGILKFDGVIADFQGDAALGFWGWPNPPEDGPLSACRAALHIQSVFKRETSNPSSPLSGFRVGIGIALGTAIAGKIGTTEQIKVGAFGPVVNLGSRLEGLTKLLNTSILIDEQTGNYVRQHASPQDMRCRKLARVRPAGMLTDIMLYELLPPVEQDGRVSNEQIEILEAAVDHVIRGYWLEARELLYKLPVDDLTRDFLLMHIAANNYEPPTGWDGVIRIGQK